MYTERLVNTGELQLNVAESHGNGAPLLMLHSATGHWKSNAHMLAAFESDWQVLACDLRGHGKSEWAASYAYTGFVSDMLAVMEQCAAQPAVLVGCSLGGSTALGVAAQRPDQVRALVLLDPVLAFYRDTGLHAFPGPYSWFVWLEQLLSARPNFDDLVVACQHMLSTTDEAAARALAQQIYTIDPAFLRAMLQDQVCQLYTPETLLPRVECPTLLVYGELELGSVIDAHDVSAFRQSIKHGTAVQIKHVGHDVWSDAAAAETIAHMKRFFGTL